jgi:ATP-dependent Lhr-like helicase
LPRLREVLDQLEGLALPFSDLERAILPARMKDFQPRMLDELGALGELVWIGRGALGPDDGRIALVRRDRVRLLLDPPVPEAPLSPLADVLHAHLISRGASFFMDLTLLAPGTRGEDVLAALWELVWSGLVTNDTFQPLRGLAVKRPSKAATVRSFRRARREPPQPGLSRAAGRWSATQSLYVGAGETERSHARALALLERYGIVSREAAAAEALPGGFASVSPVLRAMEESGKVRRGFFVEGLSGAQYAHASAVDRLRALRDGTPVTDAVVVSAVDPANPYGALLPWPGGDDEAGRPRRVAGARVVLVGGLPVLYLERGGRRLRLFIELAPEASVIEAAVAALRDHIGRRRQLRISIVNGAPALRSEHARVLERAGLRVEPGGLVLEARD